MNDKTLIDILCTLNKQIVYLSHEHNKSVNSLLILPYSMFLDFSISKKKNKYLFNNLALLNDYLTICVRSNIFICLFVVLKSHCLFLV